MAVPAAADPKSPSTGHTAAERSRGQLPTPTPTPTPNPSFREHEGVYEKDCGCKPRRCNGEDDCLLQKHLSACMQLGYITRPRQQLEEDQRKEKPLKPEHKPICIVKDEHPSGISPVLEGILSLPIPRQKTGDLAHTLFVNLGPGNEEQSGWKAHVSISSISARDVAPKTGGGPARDGDAQASDYEDDPPYLLHPTGGEHYIGTCSAIGDLGRLFDKAEEYLCSGASTEFLALRSGPFAVHVQIQHEALPNQGIFQLPSDTKSESVQEIAEAIHRNPRAVLIYGLMPDKWEREPATNLHSTVDLKVQNLAIGILATLDPTSAEHELIKISPETNRNVTLRDIFVVQDTMGMESTEEPEDRPEATNPQPGSPSQPQIRRCSMKEVRMHISRCLDPQYE